MSWQAKDNLARGRKCLEAEPSSREEVGKERRSSRALIISFEQKFGIEV